jgi:hypothetical protein
MIKGVGRLAKHKSANSKPLALWRPHGALRFAMAPYAPVASFLLASFPTPKRSTQRLLRTGRRHDGVNTPRQRGPALQLSQALYA